MKPPMHDSIVYRVPRIVHDVHTVVSGDTLGSIAIRNNTTQSEIMTLNNMESSTIYIGQKLKIPGTEHVAKDDQSFPIVDVMTIPARVSGGKDVVINSQGQEVRSTYSIAVDPEFEPRVQDEIQVGADVVTVLKRKPRKSWSGTKIYYWVLECGT